MSVSAGIIASPKIDELAENYFRAVSNNQPVWLVAASPSTESHLFTMAPQERIKKRTRSVPATSQKTEVATPPKKRKIVKEASPVEDDASEDDDPNANLLTGFESSSDDDSDADDARPAVVVPKVPSDEKVKQELERANRKPDDGNRGVIYVG